jgi:2-polyprenyl-6-methoxyphenol hydroxylase-like FAD-dependent oxidoreductase
MILAKYVLMCSNHRYSLIAVAKRRSCKETWSGRTEEKGEAMSEERAVQQMLARYVRGVDARDGAAVAAVFKEDGRVEISYNNSGKSEPLGELVGRDAIAAAVSQMMKPHSARGWSHHTTHDHIIDVNGDDATLDAQFVVFEVRGKERPATGWPEGAFGAQGTVQPIEAGYYRPILRRVDGVWKIATMRIAHSLPMAFPGQ